MTRNFEWSTTFNISANKNKILSLLGRDNDGDGKEDDLIASNLFIGESTSAIYNYQIDGIWQLDDDIPEGFHPGNYRIVDTNGDGDITPDDRVILGQTDPAYRFGILNKFRYKDFTLSFFINSVQGGKNGYLQRNSDTLNRGDANTNGTESVKWQLIIGLPIILTQLIPVRLKLPKSVRLCIKTEVLSVCKT